MLRKLKPLVEAHAPILASIYRRWRDASMFQRMMPVQTPLGFKLGGNLQMQEGTFEPESVVIIRKLLQKADVFIDIGANIGYYTCIAQTMGKYTISVEPLSQNLAYLYANLMANAWHNVEVLPVALGSEVGIATLYGASTGASLVKGWANMSPLLQNTVPVTTLDLVLGCRFSDQSLVIKLDVEGAEYSLLQGASQTLQRSTSPIWVAEVSFSGSHPGQNPNYRQTFGLFFDLGYYAYSIGQTFVPVLIHDVERWIKNGTCDGISENYVFSRQPLM